MSHPELKRQIFVVFLKLLLLCLFLLFVIFVIDFFLFFDFLAKHVLVRLVENINWVRKDFRLINPQSSIR